MISIRIMRCLKYNVTRSISFNYIDYNLQNMSEHILRTLPCLTRTISRRCGLCGLTGENEWCIEWGLGYPIHLGRSLLASACSRTEYWWIFRVTDVKMTDRLTTYNLWIYNPSLNVIMYILSPADVEKNCALPLL
jgi:hypothetical protein